MSSIETRINTVTLSDLPDEIKVNILSYMTLAEQLRSEYVITGIYDKTKTKTVNSLILKYLSLFMYILELVEKAYRHHVSTNTWETRYPHNDIVISIFNGNKHVYDLQFYTETIDDDLDDSSYVMKMELFTKMKVTKITKGDLGEIYADDIKNFITPDSASTCNILNALDTNATLNEKLNMLMEVHKINKIMGTDKLRERFYNDYKNKIQYTKSKQDRETFEDMYNESDCSVEMIFVPLIKSLLKINPIFKVSMTKSIGNTRYTKYMEIMTKVYQDIVDAFLVSGEMISNHFEAAI